jgi:hypothetical protein
VDTFCLAAVILVMKGTQILGLLQHRYICPPTAHNVLQAYTQHFHEADQQIVRFNRSIEGIASTGSSI